MEKFHFTHMNITIQGIVAKFTHDPDMIFVFVPNARRYLQSYDNGKMLLFQGIYSPAKLVEIFKSLPLLPCKIQVDLDVPFILEKTYMYKVKSFWRSKLKLNADKGRRKILGTLQYEKTICLNQNK